MAHTKVCGLSTVESVEAACGASARFVGFVFYAPSPRNVTAPLAADLAAEVPPGVAKVGLFVDPDDTEIDHVLSRVPLDFLQLHKVGDPERVAEIKARAGLPVILAAPVARAEDVDAALRIGADAEVLLFDAKPPKDATLPGGNGISFDWRLLANRRIAKPWMLAGGLTPDNVARAVALTGAKMVDVSSGVESAPGIKDSDRIARFVRAAS